MDDETLGTERRRWRSPNKKSDTAYAPMPGQDERRAQALRRKVDEENIAARAAKQQKGGSKISNLEWGLVIGAAAVTDIAQLVLDFLVVGVAVNWIIDIAVGLLLTLYYRIRGVKLDGKKLGTIALGFILDGLGVGLAPLWCLDVFGIMLLDKADRALDKIA